MNFHDPWVLIFIPVVFLIGYYVKRRRKLAAFSFSSIKLASGLGTSARSFFGQNLIYLECIAISLMIVALARPQSPVEDSINRREGIDIVLAIDASTSMLAEDFTVGDERHNRLDVVKQVVSSFASERKNDRIAVVLFGVRAYTLCPLTLNHAWLLKNLDRVYAGMMQNKTAIGSAIASSVNRLKNTRAQGKIIVLLTDGKNNAGRISPMTAMELARAYNVKIYTIGVGTLGEVPFPIKDRKGRVTGYKQIRLDLDEELLRQIADKTGGRYFRAEDTASLKKVYDEINRMEKIPMEEKGYDEYNELFSTFLILGLIILSLYLVLSNTVLRRIP
ncbi:MAG: VWA domain-containing protein [Candidatus Omnitrophica bacterium]|nr:VWA domain-containing protein [Candidatus Omnitrophota bacterium]